MEKHLKKNHKTEIKDYPCEKCEKVYKNSDLLEKHLKKKHKTEVKDHPCAKCEMIYTSSDSLKKHFKRRHRTVQIMDHPCAKCERVYRSSDSLKKHFKKKHRTESVPLAAPGRHYNDEAGSKMLELATEICKKLGFSLDVQEKVEADGNCLYESAIQNITSRREIHVAGCKDKTHNRRAWLTEAEEAAGEYYGVDKAKFKRMWEQLKTPGVWDIEVGDLAVAAIAYATKKDILIVNTSSGISPGDDLISVVKADALGTGSRDSDIPILLAYNGSHYESLLPSRKSDIEKTVELRDQYLSGNYPSLKKNIPVPGRMPRLPAGEEGIDNNESEAIDNSEPLNQVVEGTSRPTKVITENPVGSKRPRTDNTVTSCDQGLGGAIKRLRADSTGNNGTMVIVLDKEISGTEKETVDLTLGMASEERLEDVSLDLSTGWESVGNHPSNLNAFGNGALDLTVADEGILDLSASRNTILDLSLSKNEVLDLSLTSSNAMDLSLSRSKELDLSATRNNAIDLSLSRSKELDLSATRNNAIDLSLSRSKEISLREDGYCEGVLRGGEWAKGVRRWRG